MTLTEHVTTPPAPPPGYPCPAEGCTAVQLMRQRQEELEKEQEADKKRNTELFDRLFQRFDQLQWWIIGLLVTVIFTLIAVIAKK